MSNVLAEVLPTDVFHRRALDWYEAHHVPQSRVEHVQRVAQMAVELAQQHDLEPASAATAGLLHDLAKYFPAQTLLAMAEAEGLALDEVAYDNPHLLHADVGAIVARDEFSVTDAGVLAAIANHTLGQPEMDSLSCIVFLADSLEPGRGDTEQLNNLRQVSQRDLDEAVYLTCEMKLQTLIKKRRLIHPRAVRTRNYFLQHHRNKLTQKSANQIRSA